MSSDCLGDVQFQTVAPLEYPPSLECPSKGALAIPRTDGTTGRIQFMGANGVGFDFDADGSADKTVSTCADAAQCS